VSDKAHSDPPISFRQSQCICCPLSKSVGSIPGSVGNILPLKSPAKPSRSETPSRNRRSRSSTDSDNLFTHHQTCRKLSTRYRYVYSPHTLLPLIGKPSTIQRSKVPSTDAVIGPMPTTKSIAHDSNEMNKRKWTQVLGESSSAGRMSGVKNRIVSFDANSDCNDISSLDSTCSESDVEIVYIKNIVTTPEELVLYSLPTTKKASKNGINVLQNL